MLKKTQKLCSNSELQALVFKFLKLWTLNDWASHLKALSDFQVIPSDSAFRFSFFEVLSQKFWHKRQTTFTVSDRSVHWTPSTNVAVPLGLSTGWKVGCLLSLNNAGESSKLVSFKSLFTSFQTQKWPLPVARDWFQAEAFSPDQYAGPVRTVGSLQFQTLHCEVHLRDAENFGIKKCLWRVDQTLYKAHWWLAFAFHPFVASRRLKA